MVRNRLTRFEMGQDHESGHNVYYVCMCMYLCVSVCICTRMHVCVFVCVYIGIYIHTYVDIYHICAEFVSVHVYLSFHLVIHFYP